jgi:2,5-diketo-D-gluconate reductase B
MAMDHGGRTMDDALTRKPTPTGIPRLGFGTWQLFGADAIEAVRDALELGYRHIDTARGYENENSVGIGLEGSDVPREQIFITTKFSLRSFYLAAPTFSRLSVRDTVRSAASDSLMRLGTDYLDLLLVHWPEDDASFAPLLEALAELREDGWIRNLGVSNFPSEMLRRACEIAPVACNQVEYHPFLSQDRLLEAARELGVDVTAHSPLAAGRVVEDPTLLRIGERHGKSAIQVTLRWLLDQAGVSVVPAATTHQWRVENLELDFELSDEDRAKIAALPKDVRTVDPAWAPAWDE